MKTSRLFSILAFALVLLVSYNAEAQKFSKLDKSPLDVAYYKTSRSAPPIARVVYSRPQLKGRTVESLAPSGKVWRTGANENAEITFYNDVNFGGDKIKAGTYSLFTIPGDGEWTIILNSDLHAWGAYSYNEGNDVARVKATVSDSDDSLEAFSIAFSKDKLNMGWGTVRVSVPVTN
ncbi:MAG: DUF2911 domain-containing protein [Winogradskyella sp.]|uniref:DUF2911 domain-containing protein n=1 Tax=Winogradskyella sp. TaxID=1883156 RepID=UPI000F3C3B3C|nr:DUF2911 domain-containing protein [Winogradskyella sp.]RNC83569.1 MAG: DUF2911 domain-containing protein [Winogradskyella sp.]